MWCRLGSFLMAVVCCSSAVGAAEGNSNKRPNILFIFCDDHGQQAISAYGSKLNTTPNIDRIAETGMRFANSFVTNSICGPSRAVILTGLYSHLNGMTKNIPMAFDGSQPTMPKMLHQAGYRTAVIGKWHLKTDPTGFDHWDVLIGQGSYYNPIFQTPKGRVVREGYATDVITDLTIDYLEEHRDSERPWLMMCQHKAPHATWDPPERHLNLYDDVTFPEPPTLFDDYSGRSGAAKLQRMSLMHLLPRHFHLTRPPRINAEQLKPWNAAYGPKNAAFESANLTGKDLIRWRYQRYLKDYLRTVAAVDDNVGRLLDYLERSGQADNTIVIYTSDQGYYLGEHGWVDKRWMYEPSFRTPLLIRWPGVTRPGSVNDDLVLNLDLAPTILDAAGALIPENMQGHSLRPLLAAESSAKWRNSIYYHFYESDGWGNVPAHYGIRTDRHKLIYFYEIDEWEMFDLETDPDELRSAYDAPEYAAVQTELKAELAHLRRQYKLPDAK